MHQKAVLNALAASLYELMAMSCKLVMCDVINAKISSTITFIMTVRCDVTCGIT